MFGLESVCVHPNGFHAIPNNRVPRLRTHWRRRIVYRFYGHRTLSSRTRHFFSALAHWRRTTNEHNVWVHCTRLGRGDVVLLDTTICGVWGISRGKFTKLAAWCVRKTRLFTAVSTFFRVEIFNGYRRTGFGWAGTFSNVFIFNFSFSLIAFIVDIM